MPFSSSICLGEGLPFSFVLARSSSTWGTSSSHVRSASRSASKSSVARLRASDLQVRIGPRSLVSITRESRRLR